MKNYRIDFTQSFDENIVVEASDEQEAEAKLYQDWGAGEITIHSLEEEN